MPCVFQVRSQAHLSAKMAASLIPRMETQWDQASSGEVRPSRGSSVPNSACRGWWVRQVPLRMCTAPAPVWVPAQGIPAAQGRAQGGGAPANKHTCFILYATFFVGAPVKNTHGQPSLLQRKGLRKGDVGGWLYQKLESGGSVLVRKTNSSCLGFYL